MYNLGLLLLTEPFHSVLFILNTPLPQLFKMSKRNSDSANLASPRDLRADPWSHSMSYSHVQPPAQPSSSESSSGQGPLLPIAPSSHASGQWTAPSSAPPMPDSGTRWYTPESFIPMSDIDLQVLHTQVFKMASRGHGDQTEHQLQVVEQCQHGIQRTRRPELFFHGILGHVRDSSGEPLDSWREANRISNYWRRYFQIPEVPYDQSGTSYHDYGDWYEPANDITDDHEPDHPDEDAMSMAAQPGVHDTPVPVQIHQLAAILHNILVQDEEGNAPILERLRDPDATAQARLLNSAELSHMCTHLSITANELARAASRAEYGEEFGISDDDM